MIVCNRAADTTKTANNKICIKNIKSWKHLENKGIHNFEQPSTWSEPELSDFKRLYLQ